MENNEQKAVELLREIVNWWDEWLISEHPTEMGDPPIEEARKLLLEYGSR